MKNVYGEVMKAQNGFSTSQKLMISRIISTLRESSKLNTNQIQENLFNHNLPKYSLKSLFLCLKELQSIGVLTCEIVKKEKNEPPTITDYFSLTDKVDRILEQFHILGISCSRKRKKLGEEYAVVKCTKCGSYRITHFPFGVIKCFNCGQTFSQSNVVKQCKNKSQAISLLKEFKSTN